MKNKRFGYIPLADHYSQLPNLPFNVPGIWFFQQYAILCKKLNFADYLGL
jgi:hypothetical protein